MIDLLVGDVFRRATRHAGTRPAVTLDGTTWTFGELDERGNRLARALVERGLRRGDRLVLWSEVSIEFAALFVATSKLGIALATLAPMFGRDEASEAIGQIAPAMVVCDAVRRGLAEHVAAESGARTVTLDEMTADAADLSGEDVATTGLRGTDAHLLYLTSGTTGAPKVVVASHATNLLRGHPGAVPDRRGPAACTFPLFHMAGWSIAMNQWFAWAHVVLLRTTDPREIHAALARYHVERVQCVPVVWQRLLDHIDSSPGAAEALAHLRHVDAGVAATPAALLRRLQRTLPHAEVRVTYGSSEGGLITSLSGPDVAERPETCGLPGPFTEVRIADGEIVVRSPVLFDGYLDDPVATAAVLDDDGWYHTGDAGVLDEDGYLTLTGRVRDVLRTGGEFVAPAEVEAVIVEHEDVADVAVVGIPDPIWGELVCAVVVPRPDAIPTLTSLTAMCEGRLAPYKRPRRLVLVPELPKTAATDRIMRAAVLELVLAQQPSS